MTPEEILEISKRPDVPKFVFGSQDLKDWTDEHRDPHTGECIKHSGWYVVIHRSLYPWRRPDFRVLSCWWPGDRVPRAFDVQSEVPFLRFEGAVTTRLTELGWSRVDGAAIAMKTYLTAVGQKVAFVYLYRSNCATITGDYQSEGRNILEPLARLIPLDADSDAINGAVDTFAASVDKAIGESYAMKLLQPVAAEGGAS